MSIINTYNASTNFKNGEFHHAVLSISGTVHTLYLDGVQVAQNTNAGNIFSTYSTITNTTIGCLTDATQAFRGFIGDFKVYNKVINATDVQNLYLNRNLVVYYPFDVSVNKYTPNNALLVYDASFVGTATTTSNSLIGTGALSLTNTAGTAASSYIGSSPILNGNAIPLNTSIGLTMSCWVNTLGLANTSTMCLFDIPSATSTKGISVDICGNNTIYSTCYTSNAISPTFATSAQGINFPGAICIVGNYLYVANANALTISKVSLTNPTVDYVAIWADLSANIGGTGSRQLASIVSDGTYLYVGGYQNGSFAKGFILKVSISSPSTISMFLSTYISYMSNGLVIVGNYLYVVNFNLWTISKISLTNPTTDYNYTWVPSSLGLSSPAACVNIGDYLYVFNVGSNIYKISKISLTNPTTDYNITWVPATLGLKYSNSITYDGNAYIYVGSFNMADKSIYKLSITNPTTDFDLSFNTSTITENNIVCLISYNSVLYVCRNNGNLINTIYIGGGIIGSYTLNNLFTSAYYRHVALTISGSIHTLYLDGSVVATNSNAPNILNYYPSTISKLLIGSAADLSYGYTGYIDDFKIWGRALPASDISALYYSPVPVPSGITTGSTYSFTNNNVMSTLSFIVNGNKNNISYSVYSISPSTSITASGNNTAYLLSGLNQNTTYTLQLISSINSVSSNPSIPYSFTTPLYYLINYTFDSSLNGRLYNNALLTYDASFVGTATTNSNSLIGTNALTLTNTAGTTANSYILSTPRSGGSSIQLNSSSNLTISCWVNTLGLTNTSTMCLFDIPSATGKKGISVDICGNNTIYSTAYTSIGGGGIIGSYTLNNLFTSAYYRHVALSISGSIHTLYLDNSAVAQNTSAQNIFDYYPSTFSNIYIGSAADLSYGYTGYIDDFNIWNSALPASDISSIYNIVNNSLPATILSGSKYLINKKIYVFTGGSYTILPKTTTTATYLVVGGGGAGGSSHAGGGGAGGVLSGTMTLTSGVNYTITVGLGGVVTYTSNGSTNGGNSIISGSGITTITAYGGGYGGGNVNGSPYSAGTNSSIIGSGGGGSGYTTNNSERYGGQTNSGQGNNGGYAYGPVLGSIGGGGGGGGSGTVGSPSSTTIASGGAGGNGTASYSTILTNITSMMNSFVSGWSTATNGYIAAGGGGGSWGDTTHDPTDTVLASGGLGGGGKGGNTLLVVDATNGFPNTGSGGGGGRGGYGVGGNGGSGLVVIIFN